MSIAPFGGPDRPDRDSRDGRQERDRQERHDRRDDDESRIPPVLRDLLVAWASPPGITAVVVAVVAAGTYIITSSLWRGLALGVVVLLAYLALVAVRRPAKPASLPAMPDLGEPIGRDAEVDRIVQGLDDPGAHVSVVGRRGVGTSTCASAAVKAWLEQLPAGAANPQVYLSVRTEQGPSDSRRVLASLARLFGSRAPASTRPPALMAAADAIKDELSKGNKLLIVDNADQVDLLRLLRPRISDEYRLLTVGTVTGGGKEVRVEQIDERSAAHLLTRSAGRTCSREVQAELAARCGYAPAVIQAAGDLIKNNRYTFDGLLTTLRQIAQAPPHTSKSLRLQARQDLTPMARREIDVAYAGLGRRTRRLFRRLALAPAVASAGADEPGLALHPLSLDAIAAATRLSERTLRDNLGQLAVQRFLPPPVGHRRSIEPHLVTLARIHLLRDETYWSGVQSEARLLKHLAKQAKNHADKRSRTNQDWFRANHDLLRAAVVTASLEVEGVSHALPRRIRRWWFRLAVQLCVWYAAEDMAAEWRSTCQAVRATPRRAFQIVPRASLESAWLHNELGVVGRLHGPDPHRRAPSTGKAPSRIEAANEHLDRAAEALPWWQAVGKAQILTNQGVLELDAGDVDGALEKLEQAEPLRSRRDPIGHALTGLALGAALYQRSRGITDPAERNLQMADARSHLVRAADQFAAAGELRGEAAASTNVVLVAGEMGDIGFALAHGEVALRRYDTLRDATGRDDVAGRAALLLNLAAVLLQTGADEDLSRARELLQQSKELRDADPSPGLGRTLLYLGDAERKSGLVRAPQATWRNARDTLTAVRDAEGIRAAERRMSRG